MPKFPIVFAHTQMSMKRGPSFTGPLYQGTFFSYFLKKIKFKKLFFLVDDVKKTKWIRLVKCVDPSPTQPS